MVISLGKQSINPFPVQKPATSSPASEAIIAPAKTNKQTWSIGGYTFDTIEEYNAAKSAAGQDAGGLKTPTPKSQAAGKAFQVGAEKAKAKLTPVQEQIATEEEAQRQELLGEVAPQEEAITQPVLTQQPIPNERMSLSEQTIANNERLKKGEITFEEWLAVQKDLNLQGGKIITAGVAGGIAGGLGIGALLAGGAGAATATIATGAATTTAKTFSSALLKWAGGIGGSIVGLFGITQLVSTPDKRIRSADTALSQIRETISLYPAGVRNGAMSSTEGLEGLNELEAEVNRLETSIKTNAIYSLEDKFNPEFTTPMLIRVKKLRGFLEVARRDVVNAAVNPNSQMSPALLQNTQILQ